MILYKYVYAGLRVNVVYPYPYPYPFKFVGITWTHAQTLKSEVLPYSLWVSLRIFIGPRSRLIKLGRVREDGGA